MKSGIRILAVEDGSFTRKDKKVIVVCLMGRDGTVEGALSFKVSVDGDDATSMLLKSIKKSRFKDQIKLIALNGISLGGINLVDMPLVHKTLKIPLIAITRKRPRRTLMLKAVKKYSDRNRIAVFNSISKDTSLNKIEGFYVQSIGMPISEIKKFVPKSIELLRLGHIVASGVSKGESSGSL
ncbi:MAG: DUF99 family protein [Candidatus Micrarchaeota archaeon]|nr:DUF99 family protein [Candidatus Micrarchaeota archaeon]